MSSSTRPSNIKQRSSQKSNMASSTGIPARATVGAQEDEPLLGHPGDAQQKEGRPILSNLFIGTGALAQVGIWILAGIVWGSVFSSDFQFFSWHPLLNSAGLLLLAQAILIVQPTSTQSQKITGTYWHAGINDLGAAALIAGLVIIEINKFGHGGTHFESPHAILGLITYILMVVQVMAGAAMFFLPGLFGGSANAKSLYKYHRLSGYLVLVLFFATVCAATQTDFNKNVLKIRLWSVIIASVVTLAGVLPRIKKRKLGL